MSLEKVSQEDVAAAAQCPAVKNIAMPGIPYFNPIQKPPPGTFLGMLDSTKTRPKLFDSIKIRGLTFQNRIWVSPMCQYSSFNGQLNDWHVTQLGSYACRGASLVMIEAAAVTPTGRTSPEDAGLWTDDQIPGFARVANAVHSQGQKVGAQLAHGGRKSSMYAPWLGIGVACQESNGFPDEVVAASPIAYDQQHPVPREMSVSEIQECVKAFADAAQRAVAAGCDLIEVHAAHGYLIHSFMSPASNKRTDMYGGSFENRVRLAIEIAEAIRSAIPPTMPLFFRISASDCLEKGRGWEIEDSIKLSSILRDLGVDLMDISSAGKPSNHDVFLFRYPYTELISPRSPPRPEVSCRSGLSGTFRCLD